MVESTSMNTLFTAINDRTSTQWHEVQVLHSVQLSYQALPGNLMQARLRLAEMQRSFVNSGGRSLHTNAFPGRALERVAKVAGTLRRAVRNQAFAKILGGRHMECAYYFLPLDVVAPNITLIANVKPTIRNDGMRPSLCVAVIGCTRWCTFA